MRMMVRWTVPAESGNSAVTNGTMQATIESMMKNLKPEAAYFFATDGCRSGMMVFDMQDSSQVPHVAEPLFQTYNARLEILPVMNADDLAKALSSLPA